MNDMADVWARMRIANGDHHHLYQQSVHYYENRGFYFRLDNPRLSPRHNDDGLRTISFIKMRLYETEIQSICK